VIKVIEVIKAHDRSSFEPTLTVTFQMSGDEIGPERLGRELLTKIGLFTPKRSPGTIIYNMKGPTEYAEYLNISGDPYRVNLEARTYLVPNLTDLEEIFKQEAGDDADIFFYKILSRERITPELKKEIIYMCRFAFVSSEFRNAHSIEHCVSHQQGE
jgi:hypothetical protein